jgi:rsbT antagonist protein RsbS
MTLLLGAKVAVVGIQPEIAFSMVQLGLSLEGTITSLDLEDGIEMLKAANKEDRRSGYGR